MSCMRNIPHRGLTVQLFHLVTLWPETTSGNAGFSINRLGEMNGLPSTGQECIFPLVELVRSTVTCNAPYVFKNYLSK